MTSLLKATKISKSYATNGYPSLDEISFSVSKGEFIGIMGASGSGKTTLLNVLSTIDKVDTGKIEIEGIDIAKLRDKEAADFRRDKLGFIFQEYFLLDSLTIAENMAIPLALLRVSPREIEAKIQKLAKRFDIAAQLSKYPSELSGGQRQRTAAARALMKNPSILFADEPTGALDSNSATELLKMLTEANHDLETTILMVTHDAYAASFASRILLLKDGKIIHELRRQDYKARHDFYDVIVSKIAKTDARR